MAQLRTREKLDIATKEYPIDAAAMKALLDGEAHIMAAGLNNALEHIRQGRLRAIATLGAQRARLAPDVPTMAEAGVPDSPSCRGSRCSRPARRRLKSLNVSRAKWPP